MMVLSNTGINNVDTLCGAVLHDTVEDTNTTLDEIELNFGSIIKKIISECTDNKSLTKLDNKINQLNSIPFLMQQTNLIKLADRYSNCMGFLTGNAPKNWCQDEINGYIFWSYAVYKNITKTIHINNKLDNLCSKLFTDLGVPTNISTAKLNASLEKYYCFINDK